MKSESRESSKVGSVVADSCFTEIKEPIDKPHVWTAWLCCHNRHWTVPTRSPLQTDIILFQLLEVLAGTGISFPRNCPWLKGAASPKFMLPSPRAAGPQWLRDAGYKAQQPLASIETTLKPAPSPSSRAPYVTGWSFCYNYITAQPHSTHTASLRPSPMVILGALTNKWPTINLHFRAVSRGPSRWYLVTEIALGSRL